MARCRQESLFAENMQLRITVSEEHERVRLSKEIDWDELIDQAIEIREKKIKLPTGPQPHYRELLGAVALMAVKNLTYRDVRRSNSALCTRTISVWLDGYGLADRSHYDLRV